MRDGSFRFLIDKILSSERVKGAFTKYWYRYVNRTIGEDPIRFMNYGYAPAAEDERIDLSPPDEVDRANIQLYHAVAGAIDLRDLCVMEMSCGRGGGASYVSRYLEPRLMVGVDRTLGAVEFCKRNHGGNVASPPGGSLEFVCGDALSFPFEARSFDAVVSVEASHCYPDFPAFLAEVRRVLRPDGFFLYTDFRDADECDAWHEQIAASGLAMQQEEDITGHVVRGLELNEERIQALIRKLAPWPLRGAFRQFAGTRGSIMYKAFESRRIRYLRYVLRN